MRGWRSVAVMPLVGVVALTGAIAVAVPALAASGSGRGNVHFKVTAVGAGVSSKQTVYKIRSSVSGNGAAVETTTSATTDRGVEYYVGGTVHYTDKYTLGKPNSAGVAAVTGTGRDVSGTGIYKHIHGHFSFTGTVNLKTGFVKATLHGVESY